MVYIQNEQLDRAFAALADPTRRAILDRLARAGRPSVTEMAAPFAVSLPAVMKHLDVLARADLIERAKSGRTVRCRLKAAPMESAMQWLPATNASGTTSSIAWPPFWRRNNAHQSQASPSNAGSKRRRRKSSPPGRTRKK